MLAVSAYAGVNLPPSTYLLRNTRIGVLVPGNLIGIDLALCYKNLMKLTREEVQRVAMLARLRLTPEDEERLTEQLDNILHYVEKLNQLDTSGIEPFTHAPHIANPMREDAITNEPNADALLANAPAQESHFFQVPKIIE